MKNRFVIVLILQITKKTVPSDHLDLCLFKDDNTPIHMKRGSLNGLLNLKMSVKSYGSWSHQILTPVTLSPFTLKESHR